MSTSVTVAPPTTATAAQASSASTPANGVVASSAGASAAAAAHAQAQQSAALAAAASAEFFFTPSTTPVVMHGSYTLSGNDCIALARTVDLLSRCGFTPASDARFASLLALWTFVHRFHQNGLRQRATQAAQTRVLESQLAHRSGLFTRQQYMQMLLQIKCLAYVSNEETTADGQAASRDIPPAALDVLRAFTKPTVLPNCIVDTSVQQEILRDRMMRIHAQVAGAAGGGLQGPAVAAAAALSAGTSVDMLMAQDPAIAFFQNNSPKAQSYPPNSKQLELIPQLLGPKAAGDPCALMTELLMGSSVHPQESFDVPLLKRERDRLVKLQIEQRKEEIDMRLHDIRDSNADGSNSAREQSGPHAFTTSNKPPLWLEIDSLSLGLVELQRKVRARVLRVLPVDTLVRETYRSRKDVELSQRVRDKAEKKNRLATERHLKKTRRNYLATISNHCRDFQIHHRELHKKLCKNVCAALLRYFEDKARRQQDLEKSQAKARLEALKTNNEEAYISLLKEAKNERLLTLLKQTDEYMDTLSKQIAQEQEEHATKVALEGDSATRFRPTADGHIPNAGEIMSGDVFASSAAGWRIKSAVERIDEGQDETPEQADRRRLLKREEQERREREEREAKQAGTAAAAAAAAAGTAPEGDASAAAASSASVAASSVPATPSAPSDGNFQSSRKLYYSLAHKKSEEVVEQPKMLKGGTLRSYQLEGLQWLVSLYNNRLNGILADEMGLGKTVQSLSLLAYLMEVKHNYGPFLIIVPMSTLHNNWEFECDRWLPGIAKVVYDGDKDRRRHLRENFIKPGKFNIVMTTFEFAMRDKATLRKIPWQYIIIDEAHRLKNSTCKLAQELSTYPKESRRVALTGTPLQNELHELWSLLNFLHPTIFQSADSFEKWFSTPFDRMPVGAQDKEKELSMNEEEKLLVINRLHSILRPFMLRRQKCDVESDLAEKIEKVLRCELTPMQKAMYETILEGKVTMHNRVMQLRKIANHPILFHPYLRGMARATPYTPDLDIIKMCGKFALLDQILHKLKRTGHRVLIFNQMTKVMDVLEEYCRLRAFTYLRLDGSTSAEVRTESLIKYNAPDSPYFIFMLSTKAGGLGLNLQSADTVILFDSDWNPMNDAQAMARSHRLGQKNQVIVLRFITTATVEEKVLTTATTKLSHEQMVIQAGMFHDKYSHNASRTIAAEAMARERQPENDTGDDEAEQWTDAEISRTLARSDDELNIFLEMDAAAKRNEQALRLSRELPEGKMPRWCFDWCVNGQYSTSVDQTLVPFTDKLLEAARTKAAKSSGDPLNPKARGAASKAAIVEVNSDADDEYDVVAEASGVNDAALNDEEERPLNYSDDDDDIPMVAAAVAPPPQPMASPPATPMPVIKKSHKKGAGGEASGGASRKKKTDTGVKRKREEELAQQQPPMQNAGGAYPAVGHAGAPFPPHIAVPSSSSVTLASPLHTPAPKPKKAKHSDAGADGASTAKKSKKKTPKPAPAPTAAAIHSDDDDHYTPLSYSDDDDDHPPAQVHTPSHSISASSGGTKLKLVIRGGTPMATLTGAPVPAYPLSATPTPAKKSSKKKSANSSAAAGAAATNGPMLIKKAGNGNVFSLSTAGMGPR